MKLTKFIITMFFITFSLSVFAEKIIGNRDGENDRNETYQIGQRKNVDRATAVQEVENGKHKDYHIYHRDGEKYIRDNPDKSTKDKIVKAQSIVTLFFIV